MDILFYNVTWKHTKCSYVVPYYKQTLQKSHFQSIIYVVVEENVQVLSVYLYHRPRLTCTLKTLIIKPHRTMSNLWMWVIPLGFDVTTAALCRVQYWHRLPNLIRHHICSFGNTFFSISTILIQLLHFFFFTLDKSVC